MEFHSGAASVSDGLPRKRVLAIEPAVGTVFACGACEHIHIRLGDLHVRTDIAGFHELVVLMNRAAANFELWVHEERRAA